MGRFTFLLMIATVGAGMNPELRARAEPHVRWALDPIYEWTARYRLEEMARALEYSAARGEPLPSQATLPGYLRNRFHGEEAALDPWHTPYVLHRDLWWLRIASAGPDRRTGTADDILSPPVRVLRL